MVVQQSLIDQLQKFCKKYPDLTVNALENLLEDYGNNEFDEYLEEELESIRELLRNIHSN